MNRKISLLAVFALVFACVSCATAPVTKPSVYIVGDSTASEYKADRYPRTGWGMRLQNQLADGVKVVNAAVSGRSSRSFINEGHFDKVKANIKAGDYLIIQFGHNDQKDTNNRYTDPATSYKTYLTQYIEAARTVGAKPILITSINRYKFDDNDQIIESLRDYPSAMHELGKSLNVPVIGLNKKTKALFEQLGPVKTKALFLFYQPGEYPSYPDGVSDGTHLSVWGADEIVQLVVEDLKEIAPDLF
ncbi:rhamnogalacturonan acetylesterase [Catenovulum sp. 2E275]|uniref:rhamnogalacturonan acetylesterase n=1 Tax=Catenovulum sp. 2E275 TaxID=2980497 RepID=UPI0021D0E368|nr:rhamnogalacturonan acetylesterase [Catenovulum sp. 2E275]MCU4677098.1 rhamnogalacturonan acetylesterase [Catenovulum sp. 2E275]